MPQTDDYLMATLLNVERLRLLRQLALVDAEYVKVYDRLTELASQIIDAPVALVSMVASDYQFFKSHTGLPEPWKTRRRTPLSHSFCQHVVMTNEPLIVTDARENALVRNNLAIPDLIVIGYLGMPLTLSNGSSLGSFCVIDSQPREWLPIDIEIMQQLAELLILEFEARARVNLHRAALDHLTDVQDRIMSLTDKLDADQGKPQMLEQIKALRNEYGLEIKTP
jgi:GAF domain-containing protein